MTIERNRMNQSQSKLIEVASQRMENINRLRQLLRKLTLIPPEFNVGGYDHRNEDNTIKCSFSGELLSELLHKGRVLRIAEIEEELRYLLGIEPCTDQTQQ